LVTRDAPQAQSPIHFYNAVNMAGIRPIFALLALAAIHAAFTSSLHAQSRPGRVIYTPDKSPVPYAAIVVGKSAPLYTDDRGLFELDESTMRLDSITVLAMGCHPFRISMAQWMKGDGTISIPNEFAPQSQSISGGGVGRSWIGNLKEYTPWENPKYAAHLGQVLVTRIQAPNGCGGTLQQLAFRFVSGGKSSFPLVQVRVRLFRYDESHNRPGAEVNIGSIFIPDASGKCQVDLRHLNVPFPAEGLCAGIEWVGDRTEVGNATHVEPVIHITAKAHPYTWELDARQGWKRAELSATGDAARGLIVGAEVNQ